MRVDLVEHVKHLVQCFIRNADPGIIHDRHSFNFAYAPSTVEPAHPVLKFKFSAFSYCCVPGGEGGLCIFRVNCR